MKATVPRIVPLPLLLSFLFGTALSLPGLAAGADDPSADARVLATTDQAVPRSFAIWEDENLGFIKPVVQISSSLVVYAPTSEAQSELVDVRASTLLLGRLGFEGQLFGFASFRSVFERNVGFSLARGGPVGTSVWEGTGSFQARENYLRLSKWGLALTGGIFPDPASVDFVSVASLDLFGMDPYVRDPLLVSGFNQGQGLMLRYGLDLWGFGDLDVGLSFSAGNPLVSSLSFGFGGAVSALGTLFSAPLRALANGLPGSDIHVYIWSPSITYSLGDRDLGFDIKLAGQFYEVDIDILNEDDQHLSGYNARGTAQVHLPALSALFRLFGLELFDVDDGFRIFGTGAYRQNQQVAIPDVETLAADDFSGFVAAGGAEWSWDDLVVGGQYYRIETETGPAVGDLAANRLIAEYLVVGLTYYLANPNLQVGLRYSRSTSDNLRVNPPQEVLPATDTGILSMRLAI